MWFIEYYYKLNSLLYNFVLFRIIIVDLSNIFYSFVHPIRVVIQETTFFDFFYNYGLFKSGSSGKSIFFYTVELMDLRGVLAQDYLTLYRR
jgi:hypothetical protein